MKRLTFFTMALFAIAFRVLAQESVSVNDITVPQGGEAILEINYSLEGAGPYVGFMFQVDLPENLSLAEDPNGDPGYPWYDDKVTAISKLSITTTKAYGFAATPKTAESAINGTSGVLLRVKVAADASLAIGSTHVGKIKDLSFNVRDENYNVTKISLDEVSFKITVVENLGYVLDENASNEIVAGTYEKVTLKRSFVSGWNTVCLPFGIDNVEAFFGTGAKAYEFDGYEDGELSFTAVGELEATLPYIVYVPTAITENITLANITIEDEDTEADVISFKKKYYFRGTYAPVAAGEWTKKAATDMVYGVTTEGHIAKAGAEASIKGFRAYFDLPGDAAVKEIIFVDGTTGINSPDSAPVNSEGVVYNLVGQRLNKAQKGINITNGKKILK